MSASKPRPTPGRPAWNKLRELAAEARERQEDGLGDWDPGDIGDALTAVETAGWSFRRAHAEIARMLSDPDASPGDLRAAVRTEARSAAGIAYTREEREELRAKALGACEAANEVWKRATGPLPRLAEDEDDAPPGAA